MKFYPFTLAVAGTQRLQTVGKYMRYYAVSVGGATPTIEVKTDRGENFLLKPGQGITFDKAQKEWNLSNYDAGGTITGVLVIGDGKIDDNRISGDVSINSVASITGTVTVAGTVKTQEQGYPYGSSYASSTVLAAGATSQVFSAASNVNGATVHQTCAYSASAAAMTLALIAKATAPASSIDGDVINATVVPAGSNSRFNPITAPIQVAAGKGLFFYSGALETDAHRAVLYTLNP